MSDVPLKTFNFHRFWIKNAWVTFIEKPQIKITSFQNGKHRFLMQYLIRQSFKGYCCEIYSNSFLNLLVWVSGMQCNVECRLSEEDVILKETPPTHTSPPSEGARVGVGGSCLHSGGSLPRFKFLYVDLKKGWKTKFPAAAHLN